MTSGETTAEQRAEFARWREAAPEHEAALDELKSLWGDIGPALERTPVARRRRLRTLTPWAMAASILIGLSLAWVNWPQPHYDAISATGQILNHTLEDGSRIMLNSDSAIQVHFSATTREVRLARGEAYFDVTPDPDRRFIVLSGDSSIEVLGTRFSVRRDDTDSRIVVASGHVQVKHHQTSAELVSGQRVQTSDAGLGPIEKVDVNSALGWRQGRLTFRNARLSSLVAELDRYTIEHLMIVGQRARDTRLSAVVMINDIDTWLHELDGTQGLKVTRLGQWVIIR